MKLRDDIFISKWNAFQMLIWLCAYYKFFCSRKVNGDICCRKWLVLITILVWNHRIIQSLWPIQLENI